MICVRQFAACLSLPALLSFPPRKMDLFASVEKIVAWSDTWKAAPVLLHSPDIYKMKGALNYKQASDLDYLEENIWVVSSYCSLNHSRNIMNRFFSSCIMQIFLWAMSALLWVKTCFNHSREDLTGIDADLLNIGMCSLVELLFRAKFLDFSFISRCSFVSYLCYRYAKSQCLK